MPAFAGMTCAILIIWIIMLAIIGGTGFEKIAAFKQVKCLDNETPFGKTSTGLQRAIFDSTEIIFLPRHGVNHELLPSEINFQANIYALKKAGVTKILACSTVGSLRNELKIGDIVIPTQYINKTLGIRKHTFCGNGVVSHLSLADPICKKLTQDLLALKENFDFPIHTDKIYVCIEGPHYSTRAESKHYRLLDGDIIGMTQFPEYALAREAGICYLPCCFVTDYDCWRTDITPVTYQKVHHKAEQISQHLLKIASTSR